MKVRSASWILTAAACMLAGNTAHGQVRLLAEPHLLAPGQPPIQAPAYDVYPVAHHSPQAAPRATPSVWTDMPPEQLWEEPDMAAEQGDAYHDAMMSGCAGDCCGARSAWFGSLAGLYMTRDRGNKLWTTYDVNNLSNQLMHTQEADAGWRGGGQATVGRWFGCGRAWGIEGTYWGLDALEGSSSIRSLTDNLSTPIDVGLVTIGGLPASDYFDNAREHRLERYDEIHNVEINLLRRSAMINPDGRLQLTWLMGARWFRFDERLIFGAVSGGSEFGSAGGVNEAYLSTRVENNLIGFQLGTQADYYLGRRLRLFARPTVGVFGNDIQHRTLLYRGDGLESFDINSTKDDVAMLAQLDLGASWRWTRRLSIYGAYRAVGATGVALADNQIPFFLVDAAEFEDIDSNGSLILHGAVAGVQLNY